MLLFRKYSKEFNFFMRHFKNYTSSVESRSRHVVPLVGTKVDLVNQSRDAITSNDLNLLKKSETGALDPCKEDVSDISPFLPRSFSLAAYANKSSTLQQLVKMGVNLYKIENRKGGGAELILRLDFDKHMKMHLRFLHDVGVPAEDFGRFVTRNPFIFEQSLEDLEVRINYLESKQFSQEEISRIITRNPIWLNLSTVEIDKRLGFFQRTFKLSGNEVRFIATRGPTVITHDLRKIMASHFALKEDMGFNELEIKSILLNKTCLLKVDTKALKERFDYVHNIMGISHEQICQHPNVLTFRNSHVKTRHEFLKEIGKDQYNPKLAGYVSLDTLVEGDDTQFSTKVAKTSLQLYNAFLKTL